MEANNLSILIDADALVAIMKPDDTNHQDALVLKDFLKKKKADQYLSLFTVPETATVLSHRINQDAARDFLLLAEDFAYTVLDFNDAFKKKANKWFIKQNKKGTSYFDCVNMALMEIFSFDAIFSFDKIYSQNGFKLVADLK